MDRRGGRVHGPWRLRLPAEEPIGRCIVLGDSGGGRGMPGASLEDAALQLLLDLARHLLRRFLRLVEELVEDLGGQGPALQVEAVGRSTREGRSTLRATSRSEAAAALRRKAPGSVAAGARHLLLVDLEGDLGLPLPLELLLLLLGEVHDLGEGLRRAGREIGCERPLLVRGGAGLAGAAASGPEERGRGPVRPRTRRGSATVCAGDSRPQCSG